MSDIDVLEEELRIASSILEWEMGDIWGHVATRIPDSESIAVKIFRPPGRARSQGLVRPLRLFSEQAFRCGYCSHGGGDLQRGIQGEAGRERGRPFPRAHVYRAQYGRQNRL